MMNTVYNLLLTISKPDSGFKFKKDGNAFWGKDSNENTVFGLVSTEYSKTIIETTKNLSLLLNVECEVEYACKVIKEKLNLLILKNSSYLDLFISLVSVFIKNESTYSFLTFFLNLKELFRIEGKVETIELQGLFGELFTLSYFKKTLKKDISSFYQSSNNMKFDFSITDNKKIEVKTTTKEERIHHFKSDQLNTLRYDIKIVSLLMQKDDKGLSLYSLIDECKNLFFDSLNTLLIIEKAIRNYDVAELKSISFNEKYLNDNIRIYDAINIPRITEKTKEGIFNIEFDSNLTNSKWLSFSDILEWIKL